MTKQAPSRGEQSGAAAEPLVATEAQDIAKFEAWLAAKRGPIVTAAFNDKKRLSENAWKSEFQQAIALAASHVPSSKPRTRDDRRAVRKLIETLEELLRGRPLGRAPQKIPLAERAAAHLVRERLKLLRLKLGKERISKKMALPDKLIADAIKRVSFQFSVPPTKISADNVFQLVYKKK